MSNPGEKSGAEKIADLLEVLERIEEIVKTTDKKTSNSTKMKITLNSHLNQLTGKINEFFSDFSHTSKEKLDTTMKVMEYLNEILVYVPRKGDLYLTWLNYASMSNFVRTNLAFIHHETDLGKSMSTAGALSQLLLGEIQHVEEIPEMPSYSDPPRYFEYWVPLFNAIQSTFGIYHMLIDSLAVINYNDFIDWTNNAIWHYKMQRELSDTLNIQALLNTRKIKNVKNFYNNILSSGNTIAASSYIFATIFEKLQDFPDEIDDQGILPERSVNGLIQHLEEVILYFDKIESDVQHAYDNFVVNRNDILEDSEYYTSFLIVKADLEMTIELLKFDKDKMSSNLNQINLILDKYRSLLENVVSEVGNMEEAVESYILSSIVGIFKEMLPFVAAKAVVKEDPSELENFLYEYRKAIRVAEINDFAEFHFIKILCILHVYTRLAPEKLELVDHFQELNLAKESFTLKPRLYIGANLLLMQLVHLGIGIADIEIFEYNIRETVQQNYAFSKYSQDIELYLLYLKDTRNIDISDLYYRKEHTAFDVYSWIFPEWSKVSDVEFIPFSRLKDSVLTI